MTTQLNETIPLGKTDVRVPPLGLGTWQWGDSMFWGYGKGYAESEIRAAFDASLAAGITFFDTAEVYGRGRSERFLGRFSAGRRNGLVIATKFMPLPWRLSKGQLLAALRKSLERLELAQVDLYQIHWPFPPRPIEFWADALADAVQAGLVRAVGVSNYSADQMRRAHAVLAKRGVPLASNQVEYSLLHREPERNGVLDACRELGVTLIAYSPLAQGLLTGKYTPENPPPGFRGRRYRGERLARIQPLIGRLREVGAAHGGKGPNQVALNWLICQGAIPIPGAKNARQAQENAGALGWRLTESEMAELAEISERAFSDR
ncbi:MAG: aldo/keto reductase [Anaerolineae bacterium]